MKILNEKKISESASEDMFKLALSRDNLKDLS